MADPPDEVYMAGTNAPTVRESSQIQPLGALSGFSAGTQVAGRFVVNGTLGCGSSGEVLAVQDLALDREVAMKVLRGAGGPATARFMREARITAKLDHPGVPPVHTLEFLPDGGLLFTMRRLDGMTLGEAIRRAAVGQAPAAIASINAIVSLGLRICEALSRAHFLGIVHRDVKPANIMLGAHGEVALVDWGECQLPNEPDGGPSGSIVGTPAYMSPEQARGETADARSDVYALGATLYHVLTRRHAIWDEDPAAFWDKKRIGVIDQLPAEAAARVPRPLLAILRHALVAEPAGRYASAADLATDLERFQAGLAVDAYRESVPEHLLRWARLHHRAILVATAMLAICLGAGGLLWREHLRQFADWGPPILSEDFADQAWNQRWSSGGAGTWEVHEGRLVSQGQRASKLVCDRLLAGAVAIEYDGEILPGHQPGDLSVIWSEDPAFGHGQDADGKARGYWVQAGAYGNYFCAAYRRPDSARLDQRPFRLSPGVHRFRVELDGRRIGMWIDGERILEVEERLPISTGRLCLYAFRDGKAFDNVRIYQKRLPQVAPVLAIGDAFLRQGLPVLAAASFGEVADSHPGTSLAVEARYQQGLTLRGIGDLAAAQAAWRLLPEGEQADRVTGHGLDQDVAAGRIPQACAALSNLYQRSPAVRSQLRSQWQSWAVEATQRNMVSRDPAAVATLAEVKITLFPEHSASDLSCAKLLNALGRCDEVARRFPKEVVACSTALIRLGRAEEVLGRFADAHGPVTEARVALGRLEQVATDPDESDRGRASVMCQAGRSDDVAGLRNPPIGILRIWQGQPEQVLTLNAPGGSGSPPWRLWAAGMRLLPARHRGNVITPCWFPGGPICLPSAATPSPRFPEYGWCA